ncbi:hypothetical protein CEXT_69851 [Caerostris extrusa]|uniref:Uncharacterized protein n=1 Tax=Caerostris extrusa TaxID=172846 RepID=A0AAV4UGY1_CAEEX|nr:hypothetical protein CEXT_69851 [Caerostris extrusa]
MNYKVGHVIRQLPVALLELEDEYKSNNRKRKCKSNPCLSTKQNRKSKGHNVQGNKKKERDREHSKNRCPRSLGADWGPKWEVKGGGSWKVIRTQGHKKVALQRERGGVFIVLPSRPVLMPPRDARTGEIVFLLLGYVLREVKERRIFDQCELLSVLFAYNLFLAYH